MRAGELRHLIRIESKSSSDDGQGGSTDAWELVDVVRASVKPEDGSERETAQQSNGVTRHRVEMRYRAGVTPANRLVFDGRVLSILSVVNVEERNRMLVLLCTEKQGETA